MLLVAQTCEINCFKQNHSFTLAVFNVQIQTFMIESKIIIFLTTCNYEVLVLRYLK